MAACPGSEKSPDCDSEMPITSGLPLPLEPPLLLLDPPPHAAAITAITTTVTVTLNLLRRVFTTTPLLAIGCTCWASGGHRAGAAVRQPVVDRAVVGGELEICAGGLELDQGREVDVGVAGVDQLLHHAVYDPHRAQRRLQLVSSRYAQVEVLAQQLGGERGRVVLVDVRGGLVAAEDRAHHALVDEGQAVAPGHSALLGQPRDIGTRLGDDAQQQVVADLHEPGAVALADVRDAASEQLQVW